MYDRLLRLQWKFIKKKKIHKDRFSSDGLIFRFSPTATSVETYPLFVALKKFFELGWLSGPQCRGQRYSPLLSDWSFLHLLPALLDLILHFLLTFWRGCTDAAHVGVHVLGVHLAGVRRGLEGQAARHALVPLPSLLPPLAAVGVAELSLESVGFVGSLLGQGLGDGPELGPVEGFGASFAPSLSCSALPWLALHRGGLGGRRVLSDVGPRKTLQGAKGAMFVCQADQYTQISARGN